MRKIDWTPAETQLAELKALYEQRDALVQEIDKQIKEKRAQIVALVHDGSELPSQDHWGNIVEQVADESTRDRARAYFGDMDALAILEDEDEMARYMNDE